MPTKREIYERRGFKHPSTTSYVYGCHCDECRAVWTAYMRRYRRHQRKEKREKSNSSQSPLRSELHTWTARDVPGEP